MENAVKLYSLSLREAKTYLFATLFIAGNIVLPYVAHFFFGVNGGLTLLPIYFFTLIAAYKYGIRVGLLTAVLSPVVGSILFPAMPIAAILVKSSLLAVAASYFAYKAEKVSLLAILAAIVSYQIIGSAIEWTMVGNFAAAVQDFRIGIPGMLVQLFCGYFVLKALAKL